ncbi:MAG: hypothetical protein AABZ23_06440 [Deltaproteobacteria bacterium]
MAVTLTAAFLAELAKNVNRPNTILEVDLSGATVKWGFDSAGYSGVLPILKSVSGLQNKIDAKAGHSTRGQIKAVIVGRDNFKSLVKDNYLKNRRVRRYDGFISSGFLYSDYAKTYDGFISDWERNGDELTITISDDLYEASTSIPAETTGDTQYISYLNMNPVDIMDNILQSQLGISSAYIDGATLASERDRWLNDWRFNRVITEPQKADDYLNELQEETNSYLLHDGDKITLKVFAPPMPTDTVDEWRGDKDILIDSLRQKSGYKDSFFNRVLVYYDYDESGSDGAENFEGAVLVIDAASQDASQWDEESTKTIKSKWIRSLTWTQPASITGVIIYHVSASNGAGTGRLDYVSTTKVLRWKAPGSATWGASVIIDDDGRYDIYDGADTTKYARVVVTAASLPPSTSYDEPITLTALTGSIYASSLAQKLLSLYADPASSVSFEVDINRCSYNSIFVKPTDLKDITTDEACSKGYDTWNLERVMLTSVKPDFEKGKISVEAIQARMKRQYGFIAPAGYPDYASATTAQRQYAYVGHCYIW